MKIENICDVCGGEGTPTSGKPCICGGTGTLIDELYGMRTLICDLEDQLDEKQAKIDELMTEYCPDEITQEQWDEYEKNQVPVNDTNLTNL